jgi:hypothetical protein
MPDCFGFSVSFIGEDEICGGSICTRCDEIFSCDLVTEPAACPTGLFSRRRVDAGVKGRMAIQTAPKAAAPAQAAPAAKGAPDNADLPSLKDIAAQHKQLMTAMQGHMARFAKLEASVAALAPSTAPGAPLPSGDPDETDEPGNTGGASGIDETQDAPLPFSAAAANDPIAQGDTVSSNPPAIAAPGTPKRATPPGFKAHSRDVELREMGRSIAQEIARQFTAKLGQSPGAIASPAAATDHGADGDKPEDKFIASAQKHFKANGFSKLKALSTASAECGSEAHRAFITSQRTIKFSRD